ncbi:MAG: FHIPEP family type III secretion protein [Candidatus Sericytochromatia bacterium]|nr:FHIPEP family type III secretion protein [Candidatus Sericytochromatia bacterium]
MAKRSVIPWLLVVGIGAVAGALAATGRHPLALGRRGLSTAPPRPEIALHVGSELSAAAWSLRDTLGQVPKTIREALGFAPENLAWREDLELPPLTYELRIRGLAVGRGQLRPSGLLAIQTVGTAEGQLPGEPFTEVVTNRSGVWIEEQDAGQARLLGYDVLHPSFIMALHVDTLVRRHLHEMLTREETHHILDHARRFIPRTVDELCSRLAVGQIQQVLKNLLREQVSLRDLGFVVETMADAAGEDIDTDTLTERVRLGLRRQLSRDLCGPDNELRVLPLGTRWEQLRTHSFTDENLKPLIAQLRERLADGRDSLQRPVLLAPHDLRLKTRRALERDLPDLPVLSEREVDPSIQVIRLPDLVLL